MMEPCRASGCIKRQVLSSMPFCPRHWARLSDKTRVMLQSFQRGSDPDALKPVIIAAIAELAHWKKRRGAA